MKPLRSIRKWPRKLVSAMGFELYTATSSWMRDEGFNEARRRVARRKIRGIPDDRCFVLYRTAQALRDLPGDLIECGCRAGKSTRFMLAGTGIESDKTLHAFDSFEGLSEPGRNDHSSKGAATWASGDLASSEDRFLGNIQMYEHMVRSYRGWIPERFGEVEDRTFAMAHIDVDLYEPTRDSLDFVYPRMDRGGVIVCDDYGSRSCPGARKAFDEFFAEREEAVLELPTSQALVVKL